MKLMNFKWLNTSRTFCHPIKGVDDRRKSWKWRNTFCNQFWHIWAQMKDYEILRLLIYIIHLSVLEWALWKVAQTIFMDLSTCNGLWPSVLLWILPPKQKYKLNFDFSAHQLNCSDHVRCSKENITKVVLLSFG